jgi:hypothetical protein
LTDWPLNVPIRLKSGAIAYLHEVCDGDYEGVWTNVIPSRPDLGFWCQGFWNEEGEALWDEAMNGMCDLGFVEEGA